MAILSDEVRRHSLAVLGLRSGHLVTVALGDGPGDAVSMTRERLGSVGASVFPTNNQALPGAVFVCCDDVLLLLSDFDGRHPGRFRTKQRIIANDVQIPSAASPPIHFATSMTHGFGHSDHVSVLLLSGDQILVAEMSRRPHCVPRSHKAGGTPMKVLFSHQLRCLVVAVRPPAGGTVLAFIDVDTGEDIGEAVHNNSPVTYLRGLNEDTGRVQSMAEWFYQTEGRTFHFLVLTTVDGRLHIIKADPSTETGPGGERRRRIQYSTRYKIRDSEPIHSFVGHGPNLFFCAGNTLQWHALDPLDKRIKAVKNIKLPSEATALRYRNGRIQALTRVHSLVLVDPRLDDEESEMTLTHSDSSNRRPTHSIDMGSNDGEGSSWPISLICEQTHEMTGVWVPTSEAQGEFRDIFLGKLPSAIRRLERGHVRPQWQASDRTRRYGHISSTVDGAEVLGMALDGTVYHFALVDMEAWLVLEVLQNMCLESRRTCPFASRKPASKRMEGSEIAPTRRHIDGDILQRCLSQPGLLDALLAEDEGAALALREALDGLEAGRWTSSFQESESLEGYVRLAHDVLEYYLAPVF